MDKNEVVRKRIPMSSVNDEGKPCCRICKKALSGSNGVYATCINGCYRKYECFEETTYVKDKQGHIVSMKSKKVNAMHRCIEKINYELARRNNKFERVELHG